MIGVTGTRMPVEIHLVSLHIGRLIIPSIEAIANVNNDEAIIGRNVLNRLIVTLNGLAGVTEVSD